MSELHECFRCYLQIDCYFERTEYYNTGTITPYSFFDRIPNFKPSSRFLSLRSSGVAVLSSHKQRNQKEGIIFEAGDVESRPPEDFEMKVGDDEEEEE